MQAQAVEQLGLVRGHECREAADFGFIGVSVIAGLGHHLPHGHALQDARHVFERMCRRQAMHLQGLYHFQHLGRGAPCQCLDQAEYITAVHAAEHLANRRELQAFRPALPRAEGNGLVG